MPHDPMEEWFMPDQRQLGWRMRHAAGWIATILVFATANPVAAAPEHFGSNWGHGCDETKDSQCKANNGAHVVNLWSLDPDMEDAAIFVLLNRYEPLAGITVGIYTNETPLDEDVIVKDFNVRTMAISGSPGARRTPRAKESSTAAKVGQITPGGAGHRS